MIELPDWPGPNGVNPSLLDFGIVLRPATGGAVQQVGRPGSRWSIEVSFPPMEPDTARRFISRLTEAKRTGGLVMKFPLLGLSQGNPGSPVVDGAGQAGTALSLRACRANYLFREGYWLTIIDAEGQRYLHNCRSTIAADATGRATIAIEPPLRVPFADGANVLLGKPLVEGFISSDWGWSVDVARFAGISFTLEEAA